MPDRITELVAANVSLLKEVNRLRAEAAELRGRKPVLWVRPRIGAEIKAIVTLDRWVSVDPVEGWLPLVLHKERDHGAP